MGLPMLFTLLSVYLEGSCELSELELLFLLSNHNNNVLIPQPKKAFQQDLPKSTLLSLDELFEAIHNPP